MLLTTVEIKLNKRSIYLKLNEGDILSEKVKDFTNKYKIQFLQESILHQLYQKLQHFQDQQKKLSICNEDLRSTRKRSQNQRQQFYQHTEHSHSPTINKYDYNCSTFAERINQKQIVHKDHKLRHSYKKQQVYSFSPNINKSYENQSSPFKERQEIKQLVHKDHQLRHDQYSQPNLMTFSPQINRNYLNQSSPFRMRLNQKQINHKAHQLRHQEYQAPNLKNIVKLKQQRQRSSSSFSSDPQENASSSPIVDDKYRNIIVNQDQLHTLVKRVYKQIKNKRIQLQQFNTLIETYRTLLSTQQYSNVLKLSKINYQLLSIDQIGLLEQLQTKYKIAFHIEITRNQFIILICSLLSLTQGCLISELIDYQLNVSYQKLIT